MHFGCEDVGLGGSHRDFQRIGAMISSERADLQIGPRCDYGAGHIRCGRHRGGMQAHATHILHRYVQPRCGRIFGDEPIVLGKARNALVIRHRERCVELLNHLSERSSSSRGALA